MPGLLLTRRFLPLFLTQFLGALNDNLFRSALAVFLLAAAGDSGPLLTASAAGVFVLPYALFSSTAGRLADRSDKGRLIGWLKGAELVVMLVAATGLLSGSPAICMATLFLLGTQAAFFGPVKYGILPDHLSEAELMEGNGLVEAGTFVGVLLGTIVGGLAVTSSGDAWLAAFLGALVAVAGLISASFVPSARPASPGLRLTWNVIGDTRALLAQARSRRSVWLSILGISWFWAFGASLLSELPSLASVALGADSSALTLFLATFSIGVGVGSVVCGRLLGGDVSARHVPFAAFGMAVFSVDLAWTVSGLGNLADASAIVLDAGGVRLLFDLFALAFCGGIYSVPLYAIVQEDSPSEARSRMVASNNVMNALFMVCGSLVMAGLSLLGASPAMAFGVIAAASLVAFLVVCGLLPHHAFRSAASLAFRALYRVEVRGLEHLSGLSGPVVIVANHVSWLDGPLLAAFLPGETAFAINTHVFAKWWGGLSRFFASMIPVDPANPMSTKTMISAVRSGKRLVVFPEGRLTVTGSIMKVYDGPAVIADKAGATIVPIRLEGVERHPLTRLGGKLPTRRFPKMAIVVMPPVRLDVPAAAVGRERRKLLGARLYDVMSGMMRGVRPTDRTLFEALLDARDVHGSGRDVLQDVERMANPMTYGALVTSSVALGAALSSEAERGEFVGVMLPNGVGSAATFFALQATGRVPAMLNFSMGGESMASACATAGVRVVVSSRRFVALARLEQAVERLGRDVRFVWLEDARERLSFSDKLLAALRSRFWVRCWAAGMGPSEPSFPAVVLFTSGSEGVPKGVVLSHSGLLSNLGQIGAVVDFNPTDKVFNALPLFHSFGMTGGFLLPVLSGLRCFLYPSPLHSKVVPELCYDVNATVLFGTDTFLTGYAKHANPYDFYSVRMVFAGAERVREETRRVWADRFGVRILEGYGATETGPVIAVNTPMHCRPGTVGRVLPGIEVRLEEVPGVSDGRRLFVRGPNVMLGYFLSNHPGTLVPPENGWYDTGDVVSIDGDGFVRIVGRAKRFVKVAGEMVSLPAVEAVAEKLWPGAAHVAVGVLDDRKGEVPALVTEFAGADRLAFAARLRADGLPDLLCPRVIVCVERLPTLGSGKADMIECGRLAAAASVRSVVSNAGEDAEE
jgi:acyl-[acyl-carrier-protein]-phospholipid O-acyltransferase/long-chain-fatty-acid--[acyl-carrier-protein] ligase